MFYLPGPFHMSEINSFTEDLEKSPKLFRSGCESNMFIHDLNVRLSNLRPTQRLCPGDNVSDKLLIERNVRKK